MWTTQINKNYINRLLSPALKRIFMQNTRWKVKPLHCWLASTWDGTVLWQRSLNNPGGCWSLPLDHWRRRGGNTGLWHSEDQESLTVAERFGWIVLGKRVNGRSYEQMKTAGATLRGETWEWLDLMDAMSGECRYPPLWWCSLLIRFLCCFCCDVLDGAAANSTHTHGSGNVSRVRAHCPENHAG